MLLQILVQLFVQKRVQNFVQYVLQRKGQLWAKMELSEKQFWLQLCNSESILQMERSIGIVMTCVLTR